jgi:hypothetical protein
MSMDYQQWQENNARYLSVALERIRTLLIRHIRAQTKASSASVPEVPSTPKPIVTPSPPAPAATEAPPRVVSRSALRRLLGPRLATPSPVEAPSPPTAPVVESPEPLVEASSDPGSDPDVVELESAGQEPPSALNILASQMNLSAFEQDMLLLCAAMELDTRIPALCARAHDDPQKPFPTFALAMAMLDSPSWDALSPERPLRYFRLVELQPTGIQGVTTSALRADERIINFIKGLNYLDDRLAPYVTASETASEWRELLAESQRAAVETLLRRLSNADLASPPVMQLLGPDSGSKKLVARAVAFELRRTLYVLSADVLPSNVSELETFARLWKRESLLAPIALFVELDGAKSETAERVAVLKRFSERSESLLFFSARDAAPALADGGNRGLVLDVRKPTRAEQKVCWESELEGGAIQLAGELTAQFDFNLPEVWSLSAFSRKEAGATAASLGDVVWSACCRAERPRLEALAQRIEPRMSWDSLVLPAPETALLRQIADQVRHRAVVYDDWGVGDRMSRGLAINALFAGPSGTGKTLAAEVIANDLRLDLYRIDLSQVVDKYIGETEKNLCRLFDAAETGGAILFFDEADALFGKRSAVKDSHDRYANIEINYLLQRMEAFRGLAILATNMKTALDDAFLRRLRFIVNFPVPTVADRRAIWKKLLPTRERTRQDGLPVGNLDYDRLAKLNLTGGHIQNVALNAAFLAAGSHPAVITMPFVLQAARLEYAKLEKPASAVEFAWSEPDSKRTASAVEAAVA